MTPELLWRLYDIEKARIGTELGIMTFVEKMLDEKDHIRISKRLAELEDQFKSFKA